MVMGQNEVVKMQTDNKGNTATYKHGMDRGKMQTLSEHEKDKICAYHSLSHSIKKDGIDDNPDDISNIDINTDLNITVSAGCHSYADGHGSTAASNSCGQHKDDISTAPDDCFAHSNPRPIVSAPSGCSEGQDDTDIQIRRYPKAKAMWPIAATCLLLVALVIFMAFTDGFTAMKSLERFQAYIDSFGIWAAIAFFIVQMSSVIIAPIPSNISTAGGAVIFGLWKDFLLSISAVMLGSIIVFLLAKKVGHHFAQQFVSKKMAEKYLKIIDSKRDTFLFLTFLLPFFPDDIICILAGLTSIRTSRFAIILLLSKPWGIFVSAAIGSSAIQISIYGWIAIALATVAIMVLGFIFGEKIEQKFLSFFKRSKKDK